ncbi:hypothetical protein COCVIDRAFT_20974 [Bipolaris victoriae FI3]|uniref:Uncharacterized protein n=1 Tax=Bipolaris victoriae (strain FI3) TaxID=930091 RepID=W7EAE3_BIPV3|nr:hypothetical protein COCVIDRAFT_20974 [Bipolaris victoriae FI3]
MSFSTMKTKNCALKSPPKKRPKKHNRILQLQQYKEYQSPAVVYSPSTVLEPRAQKRQRQHQEELGRRQKRGEKQQKAAQAAYERKIEIERKNARALERKKRREEKQVAALQHAAERAQKARDRAAATTRKVQDKQIKGIRKASPIQKSNIYKRGGVARRRSGGAPAPPQLPTKTTTRGRNIRLPKKHEQIAIYHSFIRVLHQEIS